MTTKIKIEHASQVPVLDRAEEANDAETERYLAANHDRIIARGDVAPMEPLHVLLREARKHAKAAR